MVRSRVVGVEGEVWVDASQAGEDDTVRHPPFNEAVREQLRVIQEVFRDVRPQTLEKWELDFRKDLNPDQEIARWLVMADAFTQFTRGRQLHEDQKRDIFKVVLAYVTNGADFVSKTVSPTTLSRKRVREMVETLRGLESAYRPRRERVRELLGWAPARPGPLASYLKTWTPGAGGHASLPVIPLALLVGPAPTPYVDDEARQALEEADVVLAFEGSDGGPSIAFGRDAWKRAKAADATKALRVLSVRVADEDDLAKLLAAIEVVKGRHD
jgi:hypothetical protein